MKGSLKSVMFTVFLICLVCIVIYIEIAAFISGPARAYEEKIQEEEQKIKEQFSTITKLNRHVFQYTVYSGSVDETMMWFNERGEVITTRDMRDISIDEVSKKVLEEYAMKDVEITLGYGYHNPVYVVVSKTRELLLDIDSLELVYDLRKGVADEVVE